MPGRLEVAAHGLPCRVWIGAVGHRDVQDTPELRTRIRAAVAHVRAEASRQTSQRVALGVVTSAAEGADRVIADTVLAEGDDVVLELVCPLPVAEYRRDFTTAASQSEFGRLYERAALVEEGPSTDDRDDAYAWATEQVVRQCDVLIAVWDGEPARGRGGTGDAVGIARTSVPGVPLLHLSSTEARFDDMPDAIPLDHAPALARFNAGFEVGVTGVTSQGSRAASQDSSSRDADAWFGAHLEHADREAVRCQRGYVLGTLVLFWGAFAAAGIAAVHGVLLEDAGWLPAAEGVVLCSLLAVLVTIREQHWHERWLDHRALAEWCRCSIHRHATAPGGPGAAATAGALRRSRHWLTRVREEIWLGCPRAASPPDFAILQDRAREWVLGQIDYHHGLADRHHTRKRRLDLVVYAAFVATLAAVVAHALGAHEDRLGITPASLTLASIILPSVAAAAAGVRASRDYQRNADRSRRTAVDLGRLLLGVEHATDLAHLDRAVAAVSDRLMRENADWFDVMTYRDPELLA